MLKIIKYIVSVVVLCMVFIFIGELYSFYLLAFETNYFETNLFAKDGITNQEMLSDIETAAKAHNVGVFVTDRNWKDKYSLNLDVYALEGTREQIEKYSNLSLLEAESMVLGKTTIRFHALSEIDDISKHKFFYMTGEENNIVEFKRSLVEKYGGVLPEKGGANRETVFNITVVWSMIFALLLLMTLYETALQKKEAMVKIILGERISRIVLQNILMDAAVYSFMFISLMGILKSFTNVLFFQSISWTCLVIFLIINSLIFTTLLFTNYKQDLATKQKAKAVLKMAYVYKACSIVLTVLVMAGFMSFIFEGIQYYRQKEFFEQRKSYKYVFISVGEPNPEDYNEHGEFIGEGEDSSSDRHLAVTTRFNDYMLNRGSALTLVDYNYDYDNIDNIHDIKGTNYIYVDRGSVNYLKEQIPQVGEINLEEKVYFIIPDKYRDNKEVLSQTREKMAYDDYDYDVIYYNNNADIISIDIGLDITSDIKRNPIIMLNNLSSDEMHIPYTSQGTMYDISEQEFNDFIKSENLDHIEEHMLTSAYDTYIYRLKFVNRMTIFSVILLVILLMLETMVIQTVLRYEYSVNATEIILKKIYGENLFQRNKKVIVTTGLFGVLSLTAALVANYYLKLFPVSYIVLGILFIFGIELLLISYYVRKMELTNMQKILKGGSL